MNNEFYTVGLYDHNVEAYKKVKEKFKNGNDVVGIVHATGTGKSYIALQLAYNNKDKKIFYIVPSNGIIEHIKNVIDTNPNLDLNRDFPNLKFKTYQSFIGMSREEIEELNVDIIILDEFHHIGAPVWGERINSIIETHPNIKVFGMTAYTVRDRGTSYERDMANPETNELFSNKIVSRYDLCDAMIDGILPKPIYKSAYTNLFELECKLEEKVNSMNEISNEYKEYMSILNDIKKRISEAPSIADVIKKNIKTNGKYIYFCPPFSEEGTNDIETIKREALNWFKDIVPEEDIVFYTTTSEVGELGKLNRDAFYEDKNLNGQSTKEKLRVMFAINQYNEGIHAPNVDGIIMGRGTTSDIVFFEQLGRALSVTQNIKEKYNELEQYNIKELIDLCNKRNIEFNINASKMEIIEKLLSPLVIDLTNNFDFIKQLENKLKDRIKQIQTSGLGNKRMIKLSNASFDIKIENRDLYETLLYVIDRLTKTWDDMYELATMYYSYHKNLEIPQKFKTINGYDYNENGSNLGTWLGTQKQLHKKEKLSEERKQLLEKIGINFITDDTTKTWDEMYELAKSYYNHHKNLEIPQRFKTINGYEYNIDGVNLGIWIKTQRETLRKNRLTAEKLELLNKIEMRFKTRNWNEMYELAKSYYNHHKNLEIPQKFKTINGYDYNENGSNLGTWLGTQKQLHKKEKLSEERKQLLEKIGINFITDDTTKTWNKMYDLAKSYYEHKDNLNIPQRFKTLNGYEYNEDGLKLGFWISNQRMFKKNNKLTIEKQKMLEMIGIVWNIKKNKEEINEICVKYNIDTNLNKKTINNISVKELVSKIEYLLSNNMPITIDEKLHEIFSMSSLNIKAKYGLNLEELVNQYYTSTKKEKGV